MHLLIPAEDSESDLRLELGQEFPQAHVHEEGSALVSTDFRLVNGERLPYLVFARQLLPWAKPANASSIRAWAHTIFEQVTHAVPEQRPWALHVEACYGTRTTHRIGARAWHTASHYAAGRAHHPPTRGEPGAKAGQHRCQLIRDGVTKLLKEKRRHLLKYLSLEPAPFTPTISLVQVLLTAPDCGFVSVAPAPVAYEQRHLISPFPKGELPVASDKSAPSRAFAKLVEAELRLGCRIQRGETCIDLGASPGSWTYVAVNRGAHVVAVDRSPLREDLMVDPQVNFREGDAFKFEPSHSVDWLLCDVIAPPERSAQLLLNWLHHHWCRHFVVTIKLKEDASSDVLSRLKQQVPAVTTELFLTKLCANKKESCAFGKAR